MLNCNYLSFLPTTYTGTSSSWSAGYTVATIFSPLLSMGLGYGVQAISKGIQNAQANSTNTLQTQLDELNSQKTKLEQQRTKFIQDSGYSESDITGYQESNLTTAQSNLQANKDTIAAFSTEDETFMQQFEQHQSELNSCTDDTKKKELEAYITQNQVKYNDIKKEKEAAEKAKKETANLQAEVKKQKGLKLAKAELDKIDAEIEEVNKQIAEMEGKVGDSLCDKADGTKASRAQAGIKNADDFLKEDADASNFTKNDVQNAVYQFLCAQDGSEDKLKWAKVLDKMDAGIFKDYSNKSQDSAKELAASYVDRYDRVNYVE